jgi:hypothetical protein
MTFPFALSYFGLALFQGVVVYYVVRGSVPDGAIQMNGNMCYICVVCIVACQFMLWSHDWNLLIFATCALTIALVFGVIALYAFGMAPELIGVVQRALGGLRGWLVMATAIAGALLPYIGFRAIVDTGWPDLNRLVRERDAGRRRIDNPDALAFWDLRLDRPTQNSEVSTEGGQELLRALCDGD